MPNQRRSIVISGANGRVANHLAMALLSKGQKVIALARDISKIESIKRAGGMLVEADFKDANILTEEFSKAEAVFVYSPLILSSTNLNEDQYTIIKSLVKSIRDSGVKNVVLLSSWGVELSEKSGGILGCRFFEQELGKSPGINSLILRPVWFMENFKYNIGLIKMAGINGLAIHSDVKFPMVTTRDIAYAAIDPLLRLDFTGRNILYVKSQKEYSMREVTTILGEAAGIKKLPYVEFPQAIQKKGMVDSGELSSNAADMLIEINRCISNRKLKVDTSEKVITTSTTLEEFAKTDFSAAYLMAAEPSLIQKMQGGILRCILYSAGKFMLRKEQLERLTKRV